MIPETNNLYPSSDPMSQAGIPELQANQSEIEQTALDALSFMVDLSTRTVEPIVKERPLKEDPWINNPDSRESICLFSSPEKAFSSLHADLNTLSQISDHKKSCAFKHQWAFKLKTTTAQLPQILSFQDPQGNSLFDLAIKYEISQAVCWMAALYFPNVKIQNLQSTEPLQRFLNMVFISLISYSTEEYLQDYSHEECELINSNIRQFLRFCHLNNYININEKDDLESTLVYYAGNSGQTQLLEELACLGADINSTDDEQFTPLDRFILTNAVHPSIVTKLTQLGATSTVSENLWLSLTWSVTSKECKKEMTIEQKSLYALGYYSELALPRLYNSLSNYFGSEEFKKRHSNIKDLDRDKILKTFCSLQETSQKSAAELLQGLENTGLLWICSGWNGHDTVFGIWNKQAFKCNRGEGCEIEGCGVQVFSFDPNRWNKPLAQNVLSLFENEGDKQAYLYHLDAAFNLSHLLTLEQTPQRSGDCVRKSATSAIFAIFYAAFEEISPANPLNAFFARDLYKDWNSQDLLITLKHYLETVKTPDLDLLRIIHHKSKKWEKLAQQQPDLYEETMALLTAALPPTKPPQKKQRIA